MYKFISDIKNSNMNLYEKSCFQKTEKKHELAGKTYKKTETIKIDYS